jgi:hypothetical protein
MKSLILTLLIVILALNLSYSQCYKAGQNLPNTGLLLISSGYADLDAVVFYEVQKLQIFFGVKVDFYFLLEDYGGNAFFIPVCESQCNGTICLGIKELYEQYRNDPSLTTIKATLAHEFAHCVQHGLGFLTGWRGKHRELHADFIAGYYLRKTNPGLSVDLLMKSINSFWSKGDDNFFSPDHHGTNQERGYAFMSGWNLGCQPEYLTLIQLCTYGGDYIFSNNSSGAIPFLPSKQESQLPKTSKEKWRYKVDYEGKEYKYNISLGYSINEMPRIPLSIFVENNYFQKERKIRYNFQYLRQNDESNSFDEKAMSYISIGGDYKNYITKSRLNPSIYYSYSLQARYLKTEGISDMNNSDRLFYFVPGIRIGLDRATEWITGWDFDYPSNDEYNYCTTKIRYNRLIFSSDIGLVYYNPLKKLGIEFNVILGYRFNYN